VLHVLVLRQQHRLRLIDGFAPTRALSRRNAKGPLTGPFGVLSHETDGHITLVISIDELPDRGGATLSNAGLAWRIGRDQSVLDEAPDTVRTALEDPRVDSLRRYGEAGHASAGASAGSSARTLAATVSRSDAIAPRAASY
jgi:hypothetical protein